MKNKKSLENFQPISCEKETISREGNVEAQPLPESAVTSQASAIFKL